MASSILLPSSPPLKKSWNLHTISLQNVVEKFDDSRGWCSERLKDLEGQIRDGANEVEDALELHDLNGSCSWEKVVQEISSFAEAVKKMEVEYPEELSKPAVAATPAVSSYPDFGVPMVGRSTELDSIRHTLLIKMRPDDTVFMSMFGEVGSSRTAIAKAFFEDERKSEEQFFECCAWVTVGSNYEIKKVLIRILDQLEDPASLSDYDMYDRLMLLCEILTSRRCLIVLDDVRDVEVVYYFRYLCKGNGSLVMFTTSSHQVSELTDTTCNCVIPKHYFQETMWFALSNAMVMSPEQVEYSKKIIENCPPARIPNAKTLLFLYKTKDSPEQWRKMAADNENHVFKVEDEILEVGIIEREMQSLGGGRNDIAVKLYISAWVNYPEQKKGVKMFLQPERFFSKMQILSLLGMAGVGKSACAREIFKDESVMSHFDHRVWITLGPNYQSEEIFTDIIAQIYPSIHKMPSKKNEEFVRTQLASKRCLIVLDDLWSKEPLIRLKYLFPDIKGTTLVTTRLKKVAKFGKDDTCYEIKLLDEEESWCLLREKVFAKELCPSDMEIFGRKIAEKCEGLPLLILTVADQLLKVERSVECWNNVASGKQKSVFKNAHDIISKALLPSYERLPQRLKACFLYIGIFCDDYEIPITKLTHLWIVERFLEQNSSHVLEDIATEYLCELVDDSLVLVQRKASDIQMKTCRLHPVFWHLSNSVAVTIKLFYAMNSYDDCSIEVLKSQRRLCIRNNVLLGIKNVYTAMESSSKSRALLCIGAPHQYPVPLYFGSRLLRVLDAVAIRFYVFPREVVELIHLRYLTLTCNGKLPTSISKLQKLQRLIVNRFINTRSSENCSPLPVEIWDMKELKHLQVMGGLLPNPEGGDGLQNLSTLLDVSAQSCTEEVLKKISNLKRLGIRIELAPDENGNDSFHCLNNIILLERLESLKCVVANPHIRSDVVPPAPISMFPSSLKELSLSGLGYPWEYISTIGKLENLQVLKLKHYAFRGPKWRDDNIVQFENLKYLLVEDTDLVHWTIFIAHFRNLKRLSVKHCYKLQELPQLGYFNFKMLEIVDCSPLTVSWAENVRKLNKNVEVDLSWIGENREKRSPASSVR